METTYADTRKKDFFKALKYSIGIALFAFVSMSARGLVPGLSVLLTPLLFVSNAPLLLVAYLLETFGTEDAMLGFGFFILPILIPIFALIVWTAIIYMILRYIRSKSSKVDAGSVAPQTETLSPKLDLMPAAQKINQLAFVVFGAVLSAGVIIFIMGKGQYGSGLAAIIKGRCLDSNFVTFGHATAADCFGKADFLLIQASRWLFNLSAVLLAIKIALTLYLQRKTKGL